MQPWPMGWYTVTHVPAFVLRHKEQHCTALYFQCKNAVLYLARDDAPRRSVSDTGHDVQEISGHADDTGRHLRWLGRTLHRCVHWNACVPYFPPSGMSWGDSPRQRLGGASKEVRTD